MKKLLALRYLLAPIIVFIFLISMFFMVRGIMMDVEVIAGLFSGSIQLQHMGSETAVEAPGLILLESVDLFLVSFVLFVFSFGLLKILFIPHLSEINNKLPKWLDIESIFELKALLWQSILTTLVMLFLNHAVIMASANDLNYTILFLPGSILIIAIALFFLKNSEVEKK